MPSARKKRERRRRREGGGPPIGVCAWTAGGCQRAVAEEAREAREAILGPNHPCEPCLASPSCVCTAIHRPLLPAHAQHIRSRHAIAHLSTWPRPYRVASSTRWVSPSISCHDAQLWRCLIISLPLYLSTPGRFKHAASGRRNPLSSPRKDSLFSSRLAAHLISAVRLCHKN